MVTKKAKPRSKVKARPGKAVKKTAVKLKKKVAKAPVKRATKRAAKPIKTGRPKAGVMDARLKLFVEEYLKANFNGARAAIAVGYSPLNARQQASEMLAMPEVALLLEAAMQERTERVKIDADDVLKRMHAVATADARELTEIYHCCCRYCWGKDNRYQFTPREMAEARREHELAEIEAASEDKKIAPFDEAGGTGFDPRRDPNQQCPECFGRGEDVVVFKDTRDLSPGARLLYAGVKTTQHGMEIKTHDQMSMLVNVGKHLGMFVKNVAVKGEITHRNEALSQILDDVDGSGTGLPTDGTAD
jgi:phage terminase small subunit